MELFSSRKGYETDVDIDWQEAITYYSIIIQLLFIIEKEQIILVERPIKCSRMQLRPHKSNVH